MKSILQAEKNSPLIKKLLSTGEFFHPVYFSEDEVYQFLNELEVYENAGIKCRIPDWWNRSKQKASLSLKVDDEAKFGHETILSLRPEFNLAGLNLSREDLDEYLKLSQGLRLFKGQ